MNNEITLVQLRKYLKTETDVSDITIMLNKIHTDLFKNNANFLELLDKDMPYDLKQSMLTIIAEANCNTADKAEVEHFLNRIKVALDCLPRIELTVAFHPKEEIIDNVSEWFMVNFKKIVVLKITIDPTLIGGSVVAYNGGFKDYSIRALLPNLAVN